MNYICQDIKVNDRIPVLNGPRSNRETDIGNKELWYGEISNVHSYLNTPTDSPTKMGCREVGHVSQRSRLLESDCCVMADTKLFDCSESA